MNRRDLLSSLVFAAVSADAQESPPPSRATWPRPKNTISRRSGSLPCRAAHRAGMVRADAARPQCRRRSCKGPLMLSEALAMYESMEMPFHANRTSGRLAAL